MFHSVYRIRAGNIETAVPQIRYLKKNTSDGKKRKARKAEERGKRKRWTKRIYRAKCEVKGRQENKAESEGEGNNNRDNADLSV